MVAGKVRQPYFNIMENIRDKIRTGYYFNIETTLRQAFQLIKNDAMVISMYSTLYIITALMLVRWGYWGMSLMAILTGPFVGGFYLAFQKVAGGKRLSFEDFFDSFRNGFPAAAVNIATGLIAALGIYLLVLPGIYFYIAYLFAIPFTVFHNLPLWPAMESSRKIITGRWFGFFLLYLILTLLNLAGALLYGIGLIFTLPFTYAAIFVAFVNIFPETIVYEEEDEDDSEVITRDMFR